MIWRLCNEHDLTAGKPTYPDAAHWKMAARCECYASLPTGMAYAELACLPAITGLYTTVVCLVAYALFGPSTYLVLGPDSSPGPMIAAVILPLAAGGPLGCTAHLCQCQPVPQLCPGTNRSYRTQSLLGFGSCRTNHRCRHHCG